MNEPQKAAYAGGSGRSVDDYTPYCEGDTEPTLNKRIHTLLDSDTHYIVYLDDDLFVEYSWNDAYGNTPSGFSEIANAVAHLESLSIIYLSEEQMLAFRRMLGEAMARIVGDQELESANEALDTATAFLQSRSLDRARLWYLRASASAALSVLAAAILVWVLRSWFTNAFGHSALDLVLGGSAGAIGSFLSIWIQPGRIKMDAGALRKIHQWEGAARIFVGTACAFAVALAVKADIIFSVGKSSNSPLSYLLVACIAAGFTERLFLNLISQFDDPKLKKSGRAPK